MCPIICLKYIYVSLRGCFLEKMKSSRDTIQPKYLQDAIKPLIFHHSHRKRLLILDPAVTHICLFQIDEERHMALQNALEKLIMRRGKPSEIREQYQNYNVGPGQKTRQTLKIKLIMSYASTKSLAQY